MNLLAERPQISDDGFPITWLNIGEALVYALLGFAVTFVGIVILIFFVWVYGKIIKSVQREAAKKAGSDQEKWVGKSEEAQPEKLLPAELEITQELRQIGYDNKTTTDDHGMLIYGIAEDQDGNRYFMVKNSWGDAGKYHGIWYASDAFVRYKTMNIIVHKDAIPKDIKKKLGIK